MIPTTISKPKREFKDFSTLIYGDYKVGKSTFASQFDHPLFIDSEGGLNSLEVFPAPVGGWEDFKALYDEIRANMKAGKFPFETLVFDTADNLKMMCSAYVCKNLKITHESDLDYGKGWSVSEKEFATVLAAYKSLGLGRIYISHADAKEIKTRTGSYTRWSPSLDTQAKRIIEAEVDFIFFVETIKDADGEHRVIHTKPCDQWVAGDRTGNLPSEIPLDYDVFMAEFVKAMAAPPRKSAPMTADMVNAIFPFGGHPSQEAEPEPVPTTPPAPTTPLRTPPAVPGTVPATTSRPSQRTGSQRNSQRT